MDFRNLPCTCRNPHKWVINLIDHQIKFSMPYELLLFLWIPEKFLQTMEVNFAMRNSNYFARKIKSNCPMGAARTPTTQGLVERSNKTWKENMRTIIMGSNNKNIERWCEYTVEASYAMNITLHRAINTTPYEAVSGIMAHRD